MTPKPAVDHRAPSPTAQRNLCFGCGPANPNGLRLGFSLSPGGKSYRCEFQIGETFVGPPGHAHGGIIATILDEAMSKANKLKSKVALTRRMEVEYLRAVPLGKPLVVEGRNVRIRGRALYNIAELRNPNGDILARSRGKFLTIDPEKMFSRELENERRIHPPTRFDVLPPSVSPAVHCLPAPRCLLAMTCVYSVILRIAKDTYPYS